jgi:hypothetical protein
MAQTTTVLAVLIETRAPLVDNLHSSLHSRLWTGNGMPSMGQIFPYVLLE